MKFFIPRLATKFVVNEPWTFPLHEEFRNATFWHTMTGKEFDWSKDRTHKVTIPKGTILSVDRIYIRKGCKDFDSVTFRVIKGSPIKHGRFWAKLDDVNNGLDVSLYEQ